MIVLLCYLPFKYYNNEEIGIGEIYLRKKLIKFELCYALNSKDEIVKAYKKGVNKGILKE